MEKGDIRQESESVLSRFLLYGLVIISVIVFFIIARPEGMFFLNDDFIHIPLAAAGNFFHSNLLRPVADFTLWTDYSIWGKNAVGFHITNIMFHFVNSILVYLFYRKVFNGEGRVFMKEKAVLASVLFLLYAFHSESLFWIIGRGGSLASFFMLISLNCYLVSKSWLSLIIAVISFCAGLFTYEFVWVLPGILFILQLREFYAGSRPRWRWTVLFLLTFAGYLLVRAGMPQVHLNDYESGTLHQLRFGKLVYNYSATILRSFLPPIKDRSMLLAAIGLLLVLLTTAFLATRKKADRNSLLLPLILFLISCLPSVSLGIDTHDTEGERFLYVPSLFFCWFTIELLFRCFPNIKMSFGAVAVLLLFHTIFLCRSAQSYRYAGQVVSHSIKCLEKAGPSPVLIAEMVPSQYRGALIFRTGLKEATDWMMPGKFGEVRTVSFREQLFRVPYECSNDNAGEGKKVLHIKWNERGLIEIN